MASGTGLERPTNRSPPTASRPSFTDQGAVFDVAGQCTGVQGMFLDVTARKRAEAELEKLHAQLLETSRQAGMSEVATGVLHNVGNVLNSVNVSATLVSIRCATPDGQRRKTRRDVSSAQNDLAAFLTSDPRGQMVPGYLTR